MKKKALDLEKLGKVSGGRQLGTGCKGFSKAQLKEAANCCENCWYWVQDEKNLGKYKCNNQTINKKNK